VFSADAGSGLSLTPRELRRALLRESLHDATEVTDMRKLIISTAIAALALAGPAAAGKAPLVVAMKDPGCHWFHVNGKYVKSVTRKGPVTLLNQDEAALRIKGPGGTRLERVGAKLTLRARGTYRIVMVHQAPDDNHLTLKIR
jgi:hypothetical protein